MDINIFFRPAQMVKQYRKSILKNRRLGNRESENPSTEKKSHKRKTNKKKKNTKTFVFIEAGKCSPLHCSNTCFCSLGLSHFKGLEKNAVNKFNY